LDCLSLETPRLSLSEIAAKRRLPMATVHRLVGALESFGYLKRDEKDGRYELGVKTVVMAGIYLGCSDLYRHALPQMRSLIRTLELNANLAVLHQGQALFLVRIPSPSVSFASSVFVGRMAPAHSCAAGKVLLAHLPREQAEEIVRQGGLRRFTEATIGTEAELFACLDEVKARGYALESGELTAGFECVSFPVRLRDGSVVAALSVSGPVDLAVKRPRKEIIEVLREHADRISFSLGYDLIVV